MLVVFSPVFEADTKIISRHNFVTPLTMLKKIMYDKNRSLKFIKCHFSPNCSQFFDFKEYQ